MRLPRNLPRSRSANTAKDQAAPMAGAIINSLRLAQGRPRAGPARRALRAARHAGAAAAAPRAHRRRRPSRLLTAPFRAGEPRGDAPCQRPDQPRPQLHQARPVPGDARRRHRPGARRASWRCLQDKLPPFSMAEARRAVEEALGGKLEDHFAEFGPPVAAASIAQVHKAVVIEPTARGARSPSRSCAPASRSSFRRDLDSYYFAARQIERLHPPTRRLKPVAVVDTLRASTEIEMDLRLEAAAISEMAENIAGRRRTSACPTVDWQRTARARADGRVDRRHRRSPTTPRCRRRPRPQGARPHRACARS